VRTDRLGRTFVLLAGVALVSCLICAPARASSVPFVVTTNGDLLIDFSDLTTRGGLNMGVYRTYNSWNTNLMSRFGDGWETASDSYLVVQADGSIVIHEFGGGAINSFTPTSLGRRNATDILDEIMLAAQMTGRFGSDVDRAAYEHWVQSDGNEEAEWQHYKDLGLVKPVDPPIGETFFSSQFYTEYLTRVPEGYQRERRFLGGVYFQAFNEEGKMNRWWDEYGDFIAIDLTKDGNFAQASDNWGDRFTFSTTAGLITGISGSQHIARYHYQAVAKPYTGSDLMSVDIDGKVTRYGYDAKNRLIAIWNADNTAMHITYDDLGRAASVNDADGTVTSYRYTMCATPASTQCTFEKDTRAPNGQTHSDVTAFSYEAGGHKDKDVETYDGAVIKTTAYDEKGHTASVTTPQGTTEFGYDDLARVNFARLPSGTTLALQYDLMSRSVSILTRTTKEGVVVEHFQYDPKGNLVRAYDNEGHDFSIDHDSHGRIASVGGGGVSLDFIFSDARATSPDSVALDGVGSVSLSYDASGAVAKAQSTGGAAVVAKVRAALQSVNNLISDAFFHVVTLPAGT
jgi:YD repeat-containing protein